MESLYVKIFLETCCKLCSIKSEGNETIQYESLPILEIDATGKVKCYNN